MPRLSRRTVWTYAVIAAVIALVLAALWAAQALNAIPSPRP